MKKHHKIEKTFGPFAFTGVVLFFGTLFAIVYEPITQILNRFNTTMDFDIGDTMAILIICVPVLLFFAFIGFTTTSTQIDYKKKRMKFSTKLCGIFPLGKWTYLTPDMKLGLKETSERWGGYNGSRSTSLNYTDLKIVLYDKEDTEIIPVKKVKKADLAEAELEKLSKLLGVGIISNQIFYESRCPV